MVEASTRESIALSLFALEAGLQCKQCISSCGCVSAELSADKAAKPSSFLEVGFHHRVWKLPRLNSEADTRMKEHRTAPRYDLSLPISVRVPLEKGAISRTGRTRDISTRGVYFTIDKDLSAGAELDLTITLPAEVTGGTEVLIRATGKVVRVDKRRGNGEQTVGVAAEFEPHEIVRNEAAIA
jgi:hypothetical protein